MIHFFQKNRFWWTILFAISMAYFESAMVVYLRKIYYPDGFGFPLKTLDNTILVTEVLREAFSMLMIIAVAMIAGKRKYGRFGYFLIIFGIWDIFYYVFLKLLLGWPASLFTFDILFLIPTNWIGPVLAPLLNALMMFLLGLILISGERSEKPPVFSRNEWLLLLAGALMILVAYLEDYLSFMLERISLNKLLFDFGNPETVTHMEEYVPYDFAWAFYFAGVVMHLVVLGMVFYKHLKKNRQ